MGAVRRTPSGYLYFDFRTNGVRCREYTKLRDTPSNRRKMDQVLARIDAEVTLGRFDYAQFFPGGSRSTTLAGPKPPADDAEFEQFALRWHEENKVGWKPSVVEEFLGTIRKHLIPRFGGRRITELTLSDIKQFRAALAQLAGRKTHRLSNKRINNICAVLRLILTEAGERFEAAPNPFDRIKPLPVEKPDIHPFTLDEVNVFLQGVRPDFYNYYAARFLTGMRTGEIDGLGWEHIDRNNKKIRIRRTLYRRRLGPPKTASSVRDIDILPPLMDVLRAQYAVTGQTSAFIFCSRAGTALDHTRVSKRVWYPTLKRLGLAPRVPYQPDESR